MNEKLETQKDKITIAVWGHENKDLDLAKMQKEMVMRIKEEFTKAALTSNRLPPEIVFAVVIIPNWQDNHHYNHNAYKNTCEIIFDNATKSLSPEGIRIINFGSEIYPRITNQEKKFLEGVSHSGIVLDVLKTHAIIDNHDCRHLQIDSNTIIISYQNLYQKTFAAERQEDALTAMIYAPNHISVQNKMVYTTPNGQLAAALKKHYLDYCTKNQNNEHHKKEYEIYYGSFGPTMSSLGLAREVTYTRHNGTLKTYYPAINFDDSRFRITSDLMGAINMSWQIPKITKPMLQFTLQNEVKNIKPLKIEDAYCDFPSFCYLIKKYTTNLYMQVIPETSSDIISQVQSEFLNHSNISFDKVFFTNYFKHIAENYQGKFTTVEIFKMLVNEIPQTVEGNKFLQTMLTGYTSIQQLRNDLFSTDKTSQEKAVNQLLNEAVDAVTLQNQGKRVGFFLSTSSQSNKPLILEQPHKYRAK